jgi:hypothetical protein
MFTQLLKKYFLLQFICLAYILRNFYILCQAKLISEIQNAQNIINLTGLEKKKLRIFLFVALVNSDVWFYWVSDT